MGKFQVVVRPDHHQPPARPWFGNRISCGVLRRGRIGGIFECAHIVNCGFLSPPPSLPPSPPPSLSQKVSRNVALRETVSAHLSLVQANLSNLQDRYREAEGGWPAVLSGVTGLESCVTSDLVHSCTIQNEVLEGNVENSCVTPDQYVEIEVSRTHFRTP